MPEVISESAISLTVAGRYVHDARHPSDDAGVLARARLTVDAIDDMKMAVEEACTLMISQQCPPAGLCVEFFRREDGLDIHVHSPREQALPVRHGSRRTGRGARHPRLSGR